MHYKKEGIPLHPHGDHIKGTGFHSTPGGEFEVGCTVFPPIRPTTVAFLTTSVCVPTTDMWLMAACV